MIFRAGLAGMIAAASLCAQQQSDSDLSIKTRTLPPALLWERFQFSLGAEGGMPPYGWRLGSGRLPDGLKLNSAGEIAGTPQQQGKFEVGVDVTDKADRVIHQKLTLEVPNPLTIEWERKASVNGQRIDGSIKVSNRSGRDFDLTFVALAVNDIGRATAIGYQHFPLKKDTTGMSLPFGDTLSSGNYVVHVDVVGEEGISKMIFRTRLVTAKQTIAQGP